MNFLINSPRVPMGRRPIHHWPLNMLLREFGVARVQPSQHLGLSRKEIAAYAARKGRNPRTIRSWIQAGKLPKQTRKPKLPLPPKAVFIPAKKISLWDLWELVRAMWKKMRRELHPDASRKPTGELFATMSHIYDTIMVWFKAKGIG